MTQHPFIHHETPAMREATRLLASVKGYKPTKDEIAKRSEARQGMKDSYSVYLRRKENIWLLKGVIPLLIVFLLALWASN